MEPLETIQPAASFWERNAILFKLFTVGFLTLLLLVPSAMIQDLVIERSTTSKAAIKEISSKWGDAQTLAGPILNIPYRLLTKDKDGKVEVSIDYLHFLPEQLLVKGSVNPEVRKRGIYKATLYSGDLEFSGNFALPDINGLKINPESVLWEDAFLTVGISDLRGIKETVILTVNQEKLTVNPGIETGGVFDSGLSIPLKQNHSAVQQTPLNFDFKIDLNGSSKLSFWPLGKETNVSLTSPWTSPSFSGAFLPEKRIVNDQGFKANWKVLELNRNFPQKWAGDSYHFSNQDDYSTTNVSEYGDRGNRVDSNNRETNFAFGVDLLMPVDFYQKVYRSAKYALMFIGLTFTTFFFIELVNKKRIHPIQYILVGIALIIFYSLLLSLTEQIAFGWAYLTASVATILLITWFSVSVLKSRGLSILMGALLSALYLFLYILLQMEDYALLMGSVGLFVILTLVMYISKKVDWYDFRKKDLKTI